MHNGIEVYPDAIAPDVQGTCTVHVHVDSQNILIRTDVYLLQSNQPAAVVSEQLAAAPAAMASQLTSAAASTPAAQAQQQ